MRAVDWGVFGLKPVSSAGEAGRRPRIYRPPVRMFPASAAARAGSFLRGCSDPPRSTSVDRLSGATRYAVCWTRNTSIPRRRRARPPTDPRVVGGKGYPTWPRSRPGETAAWNAGRRGGSSPSQGSRTPGPDPGRSATTAIQSGGGTEDAAGLPGSRKAVRLPLRRQCERSARSGARPSVLWVWWLSRSPPPPETCDFESLVGLPGAGPRSAETCGFELS